jgi:hypothetical protein
VSNYAQYCSVVETRIGSTNMILGGEVDASELFVLTPLMASLTYASLGQETGEQG